MVKRRKDKKASHKEEKKREGKAIKKVLCKDMVSSLICRAPSLRTGKKTSSFKSPNFVVPSSIVQDPGIKGALFQVDCHQLFVARNDGLCASPSRCTDSAEVFFPRVLSIMATSSTWRMELVLRFACDDIESAILETSVLVLLRLMEDVLKASLLALAALLAVLVATILLVLLRLLAEVVTTLTFAFPVLLAELVLTPVQVLLRLQVRVREPSQCSRSLSLGRHSRVRHQARL